MNLENQQAPVDTSGQGGSAPEVSSNGQGTNNVNINETSNQAQNNTVDYQRQWQEAQRKITELGQSNAEINKRFETITREQEQRNQRLAEALGLVTKTQEPDLATQLLDNPQQVLDNLINKAIEPYKQESTLRQVNEYINSQLNVKNQMRESISKIVEPELADKVLDITPFLSPKAIELDNALKQNPTLTPQQKQELMLQLDIEVAKSVQENGGYENMAKIQLANILLNNWGDFTNSAVKVAKQKELGRYRGAFPTSNTNGAGTQSEQGLAGGFSNVHSESFYR